MKASTSTRWLVAAGLLVSLALPAGAESVKQKWRLGFALGGYNPQDEVPSDAANVLTLFERDFTIRDQFVDPRDDSSVFGTLEVQPGILSNFSAQYAVNNIFILEASIGYTQTDLGKVEVQAQFDGIEIDQDFGFNFQTHRIDVGELEVVPLQLTGLARFRPRAAFNPYLGAGIGYSFLGHTPTDEFNALSMNMDASLGAQQRVSGSITGNPALSPAGVEMDLEGAVVDVSDTFTYHVVLGAEYTFRPRWALLLDFRYGWSSRDIRVGFNGGEDLGKSVPFLTDFIDSPVGSELFGPIQVGEGGIIDGGSLQPDTGAPIGTDCALTPELCTFDPTRPDGVVDTGAYYVNGGSVDLELFSFTIGVRYTFK